MSIKNKVKNKAKNKIKKVAFKVIKPFLPFILIIGLLFFAICTIIDAIFVQEVQTDSSDLPPEQAEIRNLCIEKSEYLNTCHNYIGTESTNNLLDVDNRENDKLIEWSHLYAIMAFHNMTDNKDINKDLLNQVASNFESTFKYEKDTIKTEEKQTKGDKVTWKENKDKAQTQYILVESDTIIGHYTYEYETVTAISDDGNTRITKKKYKTETLRGEQYERLKDYLKTSMNLNNEDIDMCVDLVINSSSGYYDDTINNAYTILIGNDMFTWPIPGYTNVTSEYGYRVHPISRRI